MKNKTSVIIITAIFIAIMLNAQETVHKDNKPALSVSERTQQIDKTNLPFGHTIANQPIQIPHSINYQGKLLDSLGQPVPDGSYVMVFSLYNDSIDGQPFWSETQVVETKCGLFNVFLDSISETAFAQSACYLGIRVFPSDQEMKPRHRIVSVPFAYNANRADSARVTGLLQGKDTLALSNKFVDEGQANSITSAMIVNGTIATADIADNAITTAKIANNAVDSTKIKNGGIDSTDIADNAVTSAKIKDGTIVRADVDPNFVLLATSLMGTGTIFSGNSEDTISNPDLDSTCLIFLTIGPTTNSVDKAVKVKSVTSGYFVVSTIDNDNTGVDIPFKYLIIKP